MTEKNDTQIRDNWARRWLDTVDLKAHEDKILLLLALVISALVGLTVVAFVVITEKLGSLLVSAGPVHRVLSPVAGSLIGGWLLFRYFPSARGSGIPQTRVALLLQKGVIELRTVVGKFICSAISLGSGVALGREGPSVHIGAGIASVAGRKLGLSEENVKSLIPVGTAAAVAAAFNTPLAAVLFTLEEILADLHARLVGAVVVGAATSWIVLRLILGDEPLFHVPAYQLVHPLEFLIYAILGLAGGLVSTAFVKLLLWQREMFQHVPLRWKAFTPAVGGITVGLLSLIAPGVLGVGYDLVSTAINGQMVLQMMLLLLVLKILATATCYGSGNAGGIFGPSLFIGAMLGGAVGQVAHSILPDYTGNAGAYALVGMGSAFAGIVRTPMTSVIMIFEVTRDYTIIVPLMIANLCSFLLAQRLQKLPIYEALSRQDGIVMPSPAHLPDPLLVEVAMDALPSPVPHTENGSPSDFSPLHPDDTLDLALQRMGADGVTELPVISRMGALRVGTITQAGVLRAYELLPSATPASDSAAPQSIATSAPARNWLPVFAFITLAAVLIVSGLVFWQRSRRSERAIEARREGQALLAQGRTDEAVVAFRNALSQTPQDMDLRAALGLALLHTGHLQESQAYLTAVAKVRPSNGEVRAGLARIALANGNKSDAVVQFRQALANEWPPGSEQDQSAARLEFGGLLAESGRRNEAFSLLLTMIERNGDDPAAGKKAIDLLATFASPDQVEQACVLLTSHFPADSRAWIRLGDVRLASEKESLALDAYQHAANVDAQNTEALAAVKRVEEILKVDPTGQRLSIRERARRWDDILGRMVQSAQTCGLRSAELDRAAAMLRKRPLRIDTTDAEMEAALSLWHASKPNCEIDPVLSHILRKVKG